MQMLDLELLDGLAALGRWSLEGLWLPLLAWTAIALPVYLYVKVRESLSPHVRYWTLVAVLVSLPLGLAAAALAFLRPEAVQEITFVAFPAIITVTAPAAAQSFAWTAWHTAGAALIAAGILAAWRGGVLAAGLAGLRKYRRPAYDVSESLVRKTNEMARSMGVRRPVSISLRNTASPFTIGWIRPHVVLPKELLESEEDLRFALTHELIHIRRRDFALQLLEQVIGAVFVFHPLVALIRRDTTVLREITCDADVVARTGDRSSYARLLYRYASVTKAGSGLAVGIFSKDHQLTHRIRAMQNFLSEHGINRSRQAGLMVFSSLLAVAVLVVACSDALVDSSPPDAEETSARAEASDGVYVIVEEMPELVGGLAAVQENVVYPDIARRAGVEGRVIIQFVVNEEGKVVDPQIVRGVGSGLDEAALEAVRTAEFVPGKQRGEPVPVKMSMPVTFKLGDDAAARRPASDEATATFEASDPADGVELPRIDGGLQSVAERLRYPELAKKAGIQGRVLVSFVVDENGRVQDAHIKEGLGSGLDEEALRVVRATTFTPARKDGAPQAVSMTLPITFRLPEAGESGDASVIKLHIDRDSRLRIDGTEVTLDGLASRLRNRGLTMKTIVSLRVDEDASRAFVSNVQSALRSSEVQRIAYNPAYVN